ncbi:MAG: hypothetical protein ABS79_05005 [Planctomycetes bacterium SCN 63-9]|nr:MAG: hypothetical protein ABS79_05005 [Planctomycetes bacterium SCN 63-9]
MPVPFFAGRSAKIQETFGQRFRRGRETRAEQGRPPGNADLPIGDSSPVVGFGGVVWGTRRTRKAPWERRSPDRRFFSG